MKTTTLIAKQDLLEEMSAALSSPRMTRSRGEAKPIRVHVPTPGPKGSRPSSQHRTTIHSWNTLEAAEGRVFEHILRGTLLLAAAGSLAWLAYTTLHFLLAWQGLAVGLRLALN